MRDAVIASSIRTAVGKSGRGALATTRPDDLAATAIEGALARLPQLDRNEIEDVILGCAMPEAEQGMNVARIAALRAGLPVSSSAMTVNRFCASGLQSIAMAAERIRGGGAEVIVAGGTESMSMVPMGGNKVSANPWLIDHYADSYLSMGLTAERVAQHYGITREQADAFALASHQKALAAIEASRLRLRPILMTSIAFIMGVVPLVLSSGAGSEMRHAMGIAVFFGMLGVTLFGLMLTPVFYVLLRKLAGSKQMVDKHGHNPHVHGIDEAGI